MAVVLKVEHHCDYCTHFDGAEGVLAEAVVTANATPGGTKIKWLDLCTNHQNVPFHEVQELASIYGRSDREPTRRTHKSKSTAVMDTKPGEMLQCSFCNRGFPTAQGKNMHERRSHPEEKAQEDAEKNSALAS